MARFSPEGSNLGTGVLLAEKVRLPFPSLTISIGLSCFVPSVEVGAAPRPQHRPAVAAPLPAMDAVAVAKPQRQQRRQPLEAAVEVEAWGYGHNPQSKPSTRDVAITLMQTFRRLLSR